MKRNPYGFRDGKRLPKADVSRRINAYHTKSEEYEKLTLDQLKETYATGNKGKPLKGTYKLACEHVMHTKIQAQIIEERQKELDAEKSKQQEVAEVVNPQAETSFTETNIQGYTEEEIKEARDSEQLKEE